MVVVAEVSSRRGKGCGEDRATTDSDDDDKEDDNDTSLDFMVETTSLISCSCELCLTERACNKWREGENAADSEEERRRDARARGRK